MADLIVNHVSAQSPELQDVLRHGSGSPHSGMFLTYGGVFPQGASEADLVAIYRPRPGLPFSRIALSNGERHMFWTTFTAQQIDIDVQHPLGKAYLSAILARFGEARVAAIRLDAAGYAIKKPGTSCFMIPETYEFIAGLTGSADAAGMEVLVEIHRYYRDQIEIAKRVDRVYDFALPPLVLHALFEGEARHLSQWLRISPRNSATVLDTHDGIGIIDVGASSQGAPGLLPPEAIDRLVETIHERSGGERPVSGRVAAGAIRLDHRACAL